MEAFYLQRSLEPVLWRTTRRSPVVAVLGPRGSGKTALLRRVFGRSHAYVSLGWPEARADATADPRAFLARHPPPVILDDITYAPDLLPPLRDYVEAHRAPGQFLLIASQDWALTEFAGRAEALRLLPLSQLEASGNPQGRLPWEGAAPRPRASRDLSREVWQSLVRGWYPELVAGARPDLSLWHAGYGQTYLERDVQSLRHVHRPALFQRFLQAVARQSGEPLSLSRIARELDVAVNSVKAWLAILETTFQVTVVPPYAAGRQRRRAKTPKVYFTDVGVLCHLLGLRDPEEAAAGPHAQAILATAVLGELVKVALHRGEEPQVHFWRAASGAEVDFLIPSGGRIVPLAVSPAASPQPLAAAGLRVFQRRLGERAATGYVIHPGGARVSLGPNVVALPFSEI